MPIFQYADIQLFVIIIIAGVVTKTNTIRTDMNCYNLGRGEVKQNENIIIKYTYNQTVLIKHAMTSIMDLITNSINKTDIRV